MDVSFRLPLGSKAKLLLFLFTIAIFSNLAIAQEAAGRIVGRITDAQGAVVPNAKVTITDVAKGTTRETTTDETGNYQVVSLPVADYQVTAELSGFKTTKSEVFHIEVSKSVRVDLKLSVGAVSETVEVTDSATQVETVNSTIGQTVSGTAVQTLPLNGRNVLDLALLQPGVTPTNPDNTSSAGGFSVAGGRTDSVTFLLDGGNNTNLLNNGVVLNPNPDAIQEFKILQNSYNAEYGRNGAGIVSVVTKSGTNKLHGTAYDYVRNDAFNANKYFNKKNDLPKEVLKRHQYGATLGGPIWKDKAFFFGSYQGQRENKTATLSNATTVFTPAEIAGDFSHSGPGGTPDPGVVNFLQGGTGAGGSSYYQPDPALAAQGVFDPTRIDPVAQKYIAAGLIPTSPMGLIFPQGPRTDNRNEANVKLDFNVTDHDVISTTLGLNRANISDPFADNGYATVPGFTNLRNLRQWLMTTQYTKTFTPTLLNAFRFTAQRNNNAQAIPGSNLPTASDLGIAVTPDHPTGPPRLEFGFSSAGDLQLGFSPQGPTNLVDNTFDYSDTLTWIKGRHTMKYGFDFSPYQNNTVYDFYVNGDFFFYPGADSSASGNPFADFLAGAPSEYFQFGEAPSNIRSKFYAGFAQDEWRIRNNLVLTLGLRYEYSTPKKDTQGRSFSLALGQQSTRFINAPQGLLFPGDAAAPDGANFPDRNNWSPRIGISWDPTGSGKTSVRAGFGMFYDILKGEDNLQFNGQAPFFGFSDLFPLPFMDGSVASTSFADPYGTYGQANPFPSKPPAKDIDFDASGFLPFGGGGVYFVDQHLRTPYVYQYNLSVQHQIANNFIAEAAYVGSISKKLTVLQDVNPFILGTANRIFNTQAAPTVPSYAFTYLSEFTNAGRANYNGLELSATKSGMSSEHFGSLDFKASYTWQKSLDNASGFRNRTSIVPYYQPNYFYARSDYDLRHVFTFSGNWNLPFDHFWGTNRLTKGWSLSPIVSWRSGFPLDVYANMSRSRTRVGPSGAGDPNLVRADLVAPIQIFDPKSHPATNGGGQYFDSASFDNSQFDPNTVRPDDPYGTYSRNSFSGPGRFNADLSLSKLTAITERVGFEFRADFFNLFNNVQFANPSTNIDDPSFGTITDTYQPRIIQLSGRIRF